MLKLWSAGGCRCEVRSGHEYAFRKFKINVDYQCQSFDRLFMLLARNFNSSVNLSNYYNCHCTIIIIEVVKII